MFVGLLYLENSLMFSKVEDMIESHDALVMFVTLDRSTKFSVFSMVRACWHTGHGALVTSLHHPWLLSVPQRGYHFYLISVPKHSVPQIQGNHSITSLYSFLSSGLRWAHWSGEKITATSLNFTDSWDIIFRNETDVFLLLLRKSSLSQEVTLWERQPQHSQPYLLLDIFYFCWNVYYVHPFFWVSWISLWLILSSFFPLIFI